MDTNVYHNFCRRPFFLNTLILNRNFIYKIQFDSLQYPIYPIYPSFMFSSITSE